MPLLYVLAFAFLTKNCSRNKVLLKFYFHFEMKEKFEDLEGKTYNLLLRSHGSFSLEKAEK